MKQNNHTSVMSIIRFFLIGFLILSGIESLTLYMSASIIEFVEIDSWLALWFFSMITLSGMPLALIIDGLVGSLYEMWGTPKTKTVFLFIAKTLEALLLIGIVHQADEWLKGITCSIWSETIIGYSIFLLIEGVFAFGNRINNLRHMNNENKKGS